MGWLYCLTHPQAEGVVKIGCTAQRQVDRRIQQINGPLGMITVPFDLAFSVWSGSPFQHEGRVHGRLSDCRIGRSELFRTSVEVARTVMESVTGRVSVVPVVSGPDTVEVSHKKKGPAKAAENRFLRWLVDHHGEVAARVEAQEWTWRDVARRVGVETSEGRPVLTAPSEAFVQVIWRRAQAIRFSRG